MTGSNTFVSNLSQAARDNPLAAALIGGGALWLLFGNRAVSNAVAGVTSVAEPLAEGGMRGVSSAADAVSSAAGTVASVSGRAADAAADAARSMMRSVGDAASTGTASVKDRMAGSFERSADTFNQGTDAVRSANPLPQIQRGYAGVQSALTDLLDRQPLVVGAIGLAIGACCANALASTAFENEWAGSVSDEVKEAVKGRAELVTETAKRAAGEVGTEFRAAASEAVDTLRKAGQDAVQSARETADAGRS
jgi:hypothetical protein